MTPETAEDIANWLTRAGLEGRSERELVEYFCTRCVECGLELTRIFIAIDTLHPLYESRVFLWNRDLGQPFSEDERPPAKTSGWGAWTSSPFYHMLKENRTFMRCRLSLGETGGFSPIEELKAAGLTDYFAVVFKLRDAPTLDDVEGFYSRWATNREGGFTYEDVAALKRLVPLLGLAVRTAAQTRLAETLVSTYLSRDPGRRVLEGRIGRGSVEKINAALWFSDITGFTRLSDQLPYDELIPLLDDYAEAAIVAVQSNGGDVLKLIGDGVLAIFGGMPPQEACSAALAAARELRRRLTELRERRGAEGKAVAELHLGLHIGDVFYGNIGSPDRLDFTVVGPAVNEVSRISSMCRSVDRAFLCSSDFVGLLPDEERSRFVSVGRFALRGVSHASELFTVDPALTRQNGR